MLPPRLELFGSIIRGNDQCKQVSGILPPDSPLGSEPTPNYDLTLLSTPQLLLQWEHSEFRDQLVGAIFSSRARENPEFSLNVLTAGVDRIPVPPSLSKNYPDGSEGISFRLSESDRSESWEMIVPETSSLGTLSFVFNAQKRNLAAKHDTTSLQNVHAVQIPLASTLFSHETEWRLLTETWGFDEEIGLYRRHYEELSNAQINVRNVRSDTARIAANPIYETLTPFRVVVEAMGNVVRSLKNADGPSDTFPASAELEAAVARQLLPRQEAGKTFQIWAVVAPQQTSQPVIRKDAALGEHILNGQRLHRVTGGGGGWGSRKGLISLEQLDPHVSRDKLEADTQIPLLETIAQEGDLVSFVAIWLPQDSPDALAESLGDSIGHQRGLSGICFGSAGPLTDAAASQISHNGESNKDVLVQSHFGALSERGAVLHTYALGGGGLPKDLVPKRLVNSTKLPPGCALEWTQT